MTDAAQIVAQAARVLYGEEWGAPLASALSINPRTAQRIKAAALAGQPYPVSPGMMRDLVALLRKQAEACEDVAQLVEACAAERP